jgi:hypothetical protein
MSVRGREAEPKPIGIYSRRLMDEVINLDEREIKEITWLAQLQLTF